MPQMRLEDGTAEFHFNHHFITALTSRILTQAMSSFEAGITPPYKRVETTGQGTPPII